MKQSIDIYKSKEAYKRSLKNFLNDKRISESNKRVVKDYLLIKEKELAQGYTKEELKNEGIRHAKTLQKYVLYCGNCALWFKDLNKITSKELEKFKKDLFDLKLVTRAGRPLNNIHDILSKVIKSSFFKRHLGLAQEVENIFYDKIKKKKTIPNYITEDDYKRLYNLMPSYDGKMAVTIMFYTGLRVGELLHLTKSDFLIEYDKETKNKYYNILVREHGSKSHQNRKVPIIFPEVNDLIIKFLEPLKPIDKVIKVNYRTLYNQITKTCKESGIKTIPDGLNVACHTLRKSATTNLQNYDMSIDDLKSILGHSPSSSAIDVYQNLGNRKYKKQIDKVVNVGYSELKKQNEDLNTQLLVMQRQKDKSDKKIDDMEKKYDAIMDKLAKKYGV